MWFTHPMFALFQTDKNFEYILTELGRDFSLPGNTIEATRIFPKLQKDNVQLCTQFSLISNWCQYFHTFLWYCFSACKYQKYFY